MQIISGAEMLEEMDERAGSVHYFRQMHTEKLRIIIPAVCFWISIKCFETWGISRLDLSCLISKVRGALQMDDASSSCNLMDIKQAEHQVLRLLAWNVIRHTGSVDQMEEIFIKGMDASKNTKQVQRQILLVLYRAFSSVSKSS
jgi:hypothetical protein